MSKHTIEILDITEVSNFTHEYNIRLDGTQMKCRTTAMFPHFAHDMTFRITFSDRSVRQTPEYKEIRSELLTKFKRVHGID